MTGRNQVRINLATMIEACQLLIDRDSPGAGKVTCVEADHAQVTGPIFVITLQADDKSKQEELLR